MALANVGSVEGLEAHSPLLAGRALRALEVTRPAGNSCQGGDQEIPNRELRCEKARNSGLFARHQERSFKN
jgi:hypothetical protein